MTKTKKPISEEIPQVLSHVPKKGDVAWIYTQDGPEQVEVLGTTMLVELQTMNGGGRWFSRLSTEMWESEGEARKEGASTAKASNEYYRDNARLHDESARLEAKILRLEEKRKEMETEINALKEKMDEMRASQAEELAGLFDD